jgi:hypothetical protein
MGRTLKKVPLDFNWPLNKKWGGYLNPYWEHAAQCSKCDGTKLNPETKQLEDDWYDFAETGRRWCDKLTQDEVDYLHKKGRLHNFPDGATAEQVNKAERKGGLLTHDTINCWTMVEFRAKKLGVYWHCNNGCDEDGYLWASPDSKKAHEEWEPFDPPEGDGFQLWETTSEGSPTTPVFKTMEELCAYAAEHCSTFADCKATAEEWREMLDKDFVVAKRGNMLFI